MGNVSFNVFGSISNKEHQGRIFNEANVFRRFGKVVCIKTKNLTKMVKIEIVLQVII